MSILLIFYILFLLGYLGVNTYIIIRVNSMRIKSDLTNRGIIVYAIAMAAVILISLVLISSLDWKSSLLGTGGALGL